MSLDKAIDNAVDWCIKHNIMAKYLAMHRAEVKDMFLTEYDEQETMSLFQKEYETQAILNMYDLGVPIEKICQKYDPKLVHKVLGKQEFS